MIAPATLQINKKNCEIIRYKIVGFVGVVAGIACLAQVIFSILAVSGAGYAPTTFGLGLINISAASLLILGCIILPASGGSEEAIGKLIAIAVVIAAFSTFIFVNVYGMCGYLSVETLAFLSLCTPLLPFFAIASGAVTVPWLSHALIKESREEIRVLTPQAQRQRTFLERKAELVRLFRAGLANPDGAEAASFEELRPQFEIDYPHQVKAIKRVVMKSLWLEAKANPNGPVYNLFIKYIPLFEADWPGELANLMSECE